MAEPWREQYRHRLTSAEAALARVRSGDRIAVSTIIEPEALLVALAGRLGDLRDVKLLWCLPLTDCGWFDPGMEHAFEIMVRTFTPHPAPPRHRPG